jgi:hypothetical protein
MRSLCFASLGTPLLDSNRSWSSSQFLRAVAITGSSVRVRSCCANASPNPREAGVTNANPWAAGSMMYLLDQLQVVFYSIEREWKELQHGVLMSSLHMTSQSMSIIDLIS